MGVCQSPRSSLSIPIPPSSGSQPLRAAVWVPPVATLDIRRLARLVLVVGVEAHELLLDLVRLLLVPIADVVGLILPLFAEDFGDVVVLSIWVRLLHTLVSLAAIDDEGVGGTRQLGVARGDGIDKLESVLRTDVETGWTRVVTKCDALLSGDLVQDHEGRLPVTVAHVLPRNGVDTANLGGVVSMELDANVLEDVEVLERID